MAVLLNGGEGLTTTITTNGATIPAGTGETAMVAAITSGSSIAPDTSIFAHGAKSMSMTPVSTGPVYARSPSSNGSTGVSTAAFDMLVRVPGVTAPASGSEPYFLQAVGVGGGTLFSATWVGTSGFLRQRDGSGAATTTTTAFNPSTAFLRIAMYININTTTPANSTCHIAAYPLDSNTPISGLDLGTLTKAPATPNVLIDYFKFGRANTDADTNVFKVDDARWDYAATDIIPVTAASLTGVVTPSDHAAGTLQTLTLTPSGFTPTSYSGTWVTGPTGNRITTNWGPQSSNVVTRTDSAGDVGNTVNWTATGTG